MSPRQKGVTLPPYVPENGYPGGDGPAWISIALGAPKCLVDVTRFLSDDGEETALILHFGNGRRLIFRPARVVMTRRLTDTIGALGFPVPYYSPPDIARLGAAIGRIADRDVTEQQESSAENTVSLVAAWVAAQVRERPCHELTGRKGADVRAAMEAVRRGTSDTATQLVYEPERDVLLVWTVPVAMLIRQRLGTMADAKIGLHLRSAGLHRERLAARPAPDSRAPRELPVWVVPNGWADSEAENSLDSGEFVPAEEDAVVDRLAPSTHARPRAHMCVISNERSTTPNGSGGDSSENGLAPKPFADAWREAGEWP